MEIEIVTTKKKLTMSVVSQMPLAKYEDIHFAMMHPLHRVLGYINGYKLGKTVCSAAIIKTPSDWAVFPLAEVKMLERKDSRQALDEKGEPIDYASEYYNVYYTHQKVGSINFTSKAVEDKELIENKVKTMNSLIKFAKGLHIYL